MPYWDWAQGTTTGPVPDFFMTPTLRVNDTDGTEVLIFNPLYSYKFKPVPDQFTEKARHPRSSERIVRARANRL
jgi:tyrosinase